MSDNQYPAASPLERHQRAPVAEIAEGGTVRWLSRDQALPAGTKLFADQTPKGRCEQFAVPEGLHPRTADLVARFAAAVAEKLADAERKYGYSDGWADPAWMDECRAQLAGHVAKGDPRDVAAYCAFLWHHGERTEEAPRQGTVKTPMTNAWRPLTEGAPAKGRLGLCLVKGVATHPIAGSYESFALCEGRTSNGEMVPANVPKSFTPTAFLPLEELESALAGHPVLNAESGAVT